MMLVFNRRAGEALHINVNIEITKVGTSLVKTTVHAPREIKVMRQEILPSDHPLTHQYHTAASSGQTCQLATHHKGPLPLWYPSVFHADLVMMQVPALTLMLYTMPTVRLPLGSKPMQRFQGLVLLMATRDPVTVSALLTFLHQRIHSQIVLISGRIGYAPNHLAPHK